MVTTVVLQEEPPHKKSKKGIFFFLGILVLIVLSLIFFWWLFFGKRRKTFYLCDPVLKECTSSVEDSNYENPNAYLDEDPCIDNCKDIHYKCIPSTKQCEEIFGSNVNYDIAYIGEDACKEACKDETTSYCGEKGCYTGQQEYPIYQVYPSPQDCTEQCKSFQCAASSDYLECISLPGMSGKTSKEECNPYCGNNYKEVCKETRTNNIPKNECIMDTEGIGTDACGSSCITRYYCARDSEACVLYETEDDVIYGDYVPCMDQCYKTYSCVDQACKPIKNGTFASLDICDSSCAQYLCTTDPQNPYTDDFDYDPLTNFPVLDIENAKLVCGGKKFIIISEVSVENSPFFLTDLPNGGWQLLLGTAAETKRGENQYPYWQYFNQGGTSRLIQTVYKSDSPNWVLRVYRHGEGSHGNPPWARFGKVNYAQEDELVTFIESSNKPSALFPDKITVCIKNRSLTESYFLTAPKASDIPIPGFINETSSFFTTTPDDSNKNMWFTIHEVGKGTDFPIISPGLDEEYPYVVN